MKNIRRRMCLGLLIVLVAVLASGCTLFASGKYKNAQELLNAGDYAQAKTVFEEVRTYEDAEKYLAYIAAVQQAEAGDCVGATEGFAALGDFRNSASLTLYYTALQAEAEERFEDADAAYQQLGDFRDSVARKQALPELIVAWDERIREEKYAQGQ